MSVLHSNTAPAVPASTTYLFTREQLLNALVAYTSAMPEPQQSEARKTILDFLDAPGGSLIWTRGT